MAGPLRGGGKGPDIKEKITLLKTLFEILLPFKNKNNFTLDNLSKYGHILSVDNFKASMAWPLRK